MRPTFLGFEASKTALFASQKALDITGNNLSNISSEGYTRQRVDQISVGYQDYATRGNMGVRVALAGQGTEILGIGQTRDKQLDNAFRLQNSEIGETSQRSAIYSDIENALQEFDIGSDGNGYGLRNAVSNLYNSLQNFSMDASSPTYAAVTADAFDKLASSINDMYSNLEDVAEKYKSSLSDDCSAVNVSLEKIAGLNKDIREAMVANQYTQEYGPNELLDQRNALIDKISSYAETSIKFNSDGTVDVSLGGHTAVSGENADALNYVENTDGTVDVYWKNSGENAGAGTGKIAAAIDVLNGRGTGVQSPTESTDKGVLYYMDKLNKFASTIADVCNSTIPETVDANGNPLTYKKLFGAAVADKDGTYDVYNDMLITADNISVSNELDNNVNYLLFNGGGNSDNTYLLNLTAKLSKSSFDFGEFKGTFEDYITDYSTGLGKDISYNSEKNAAAVIVGKSLDASRDSVIGVSETEETTNMLSYNRAFQAASRMMTVMDDLLNVIINQMAV